MSRQKIAIALVIALSGPVPPASGESALRSRVTSLMLDSRGYAGWVKDNEEYVEELCATQSGSEHEYAFQTWGLVVSNDADRVASIRSPNPPYSVSWLVTCSDKSVERVPILDSSEFAPDAEVNLDPHERQARALAQMEKARQERAAHLKFIKDNEAYIRMLCNTEPGEAHREAWAMYRFAVSTDHAHVAEAVKEAALTIGCESDMHTFVPWLPPISHEDE